MALSDYKVFSQFAYSTAAEILMQNVALFNEASRNTIFLRDAANIGNYSEVAFWKHLSGIVRRRNAYGSGAVTPVNLEHLLQTSVKVASGTPPIEMPPSQMTWIQRSPEEAGAAVGKELAADMLADMLNTGIIAVRTALSQVSAVNYDGTSDTINTMNPKQLNNGSRLFGDQSQSITAWIMHSSALHDFYGNAIDNKNGLFQYGSVNVLSDPMGRVFIVSDSPGLITTGSPDTYHTLGLVSGAVMVEQNGDFKQNIETNNGYENIKQSYQAEWSYNVAVKGFAWDKTSGGPSPTDAAIASATNWDRYATSEKSLAGVVVNTR